MPIVDYNRIYRVRLQERKPITNPVTGPDAAGAFLRGAVPAALAPMHGLNARIDAIRGETDARNRRDALRFEGVASGIRAAGDAYQTYIRAMERRDAAELDKLEAAYSAHMISGAEGAYGTRRETSDGKVTNGPGAAIRQLDRDFEESDAYKAANRRVKNAFAPRREARRAVYFAKGDRLQFEAARAEHAQAVKDKADNDDIAVSRNLDPYNYRTWKEQMEIAIESDQHQLRLGMGLVEMQADGTERAVREPTEEEQRTLANQRLAKRDAYILQRALYYGNLIANDDGTLSQTPHLEAVLEAIANDAGFSVGQNADDGMPDSDVAFANESIASPLVRQKIGEILTNARQSRERNVAAALRIDNGKADRLADRIGMGAATDEEIKEFDAIMNRLPDQDRAAHQATRQHAAEFREWQVWAKTYVDTIPTGEGATLEATLGAIGAARREAAKLSPRAQSLAEKSLLPFRPVEDEYGKMCVGAIDVLCSLGVWNGQDVDLRRTRDILTDAVESGIIDARKFDSLFSAAQKSAEARAARASAMPGPGTGEEFQRVMRRFLPDRVVDRFTQIDVKSHALSFTDRFDESGSYDTPEKWSDRSNAVLATMVNAMTRFHALQATGRLKPEQTLDSFVAEVMTNDENYRQMTDEAVIKAFDDRIEELEDAANKEDASRLNPYFRTSYDAPRFDLMSGKQK
jgi:hypothetical protein